MAWVSRASSRLSGGSTVTSRSASIVLPTPGGPDISRWCPPVAAELEGEPRLRLADDVGEVGPGPSRGRHPPSGGGAGGSGVPCCGRDVPVDDVAQARRPRAPSPRRRAAPRRRSRPARRRAAPRRGPPRAPPAGRRARPAPSRRAPARPGGRRRRATPAPDHARRPRAPRPRSAGRSTAPRLGMEAGERLTVTRCGGHRHPAGRGRGPHPVGRLRARGVGHAADREVRQALRDVRLDVDDGAVEAATGRPTGCARGRASRPHPHDVPDDGAADPGRHRMPTTSTRTCAARARLGVPARGRPPPAAAAASPWRRSPPRPARRSPAPRRVLTSQMTRQSPSRATTSTSPCSQRQLRSSTSMPCSRR